MARGEVPWLGSRFTFDEPPLVAVQDFSATLYDLNLLYELVALVSIPTYGDFKPTSRFGFRHGRPTLPEHRAYLYRANYESPLLLELVTSPIALAAAGPILIRGWIAAVDELIELVDKLVDRQQLRQEAEEERVVRGLERRKRRRELEAEDAASEQQQLNQVIDEVIEHRDHGRRYLHAYLEEHGAERTYTVIQRRIVTGPLVPRQLELFAAFGVGEEATRTDEE